MWRICYYIDIMSMAMGNIVSLVIRKMRADPNEADL